MDDDQPSPDLWAGDRVRRWLRQSAGLERQFASVSEVLLKAAELRPGEAVLDVGCGTGPTTYAAATAVGTGGRVCGLDVSAEMLAAAAANPKPEPHAPIEWVQADAVTWTPEPGCFDAVISRFGVMFFSDPMIAFANLLSATRPGGRLAMAVWQRRDASELFSVSLNATLEVLRLHNIASTATGVALDDFVAADDRGPFSFSSPTTQGLLALSGWTDVAMTPHVLDLPFAGGVEPGPAAEAAVDFGPTRELLDGVDPSVVAKAKGAIAAAFAGHTDVEGHVVLSGAISLVTARRVA